jgi:hypothetical protein
MGDKLAKIYQAAPKEIEAGLVKSTYVKKEFVICAGCDVEAFGSGEGFPHHRQCPNKKLVRVCPV